MDIVKNIFLGIFLMYFLLDVGSGIVLATKDMNVIQKLTRDVYSKKFLLYTIFVILLGIGLIWLLSATDDNCPSWLTKPDDCWNKGIINAWYEKILKWVEHGAKDFCDKHPDNKACHHIYPISS